VLEAARLLGPCAIVQASSAAAVGRPASMYGATKRSAEALARAYHGREGLDVRGVRLLPLIGLSLTYIEPPTPASDAVNGREQFLYGRLATIASVMVQEATGRRPWAVPAPRDVPLHAMYRRDAARALTMLAEADGTRLRQRIYNVAGPEPVATLGDLAAALQAVEPAASFTFDDEPAAAQRVAAAHDVAYADAEAREDWGWEAHFTAETLARDAVDEVRRRPHLYANRRPQAGS
jgi:nucleoside-diphosphate-sugar epimerase